MNALSATHFNFPGQTGTYKGKVRDVYYLDNNRLLMVATDRISAFDVVLPRAIPFKGQVLNQLAAHFLKTTKDIVPNWFEAAPDPNVSFGVACEAYPVEMVVRGYLAGHAGRTYRSGLRTLCGVALPEGLHENDKLPHPIITPTTKAHEGHDEDISREEIIARGLVSEEDYIQLEKYALLLFERGTQMASQQGLILVDTKYEFGKSSDKIVLIDEIHTPDSSRYFYADGYAERQQQQLPQKQLSKEFVREWLIANGFQGKEGQTVPEMNDGWVTQISERYIELYEQVTGKQFVRANADDIEQRIVSNVAAFL